MFGSTKKFGPISTSHRNWRAADNTDRDSVRCSWCHGYSRYVQFTFFGDIDDKGWVYDFGDLKFVKEWLDRHWDHRTLISDDDPKLDMLLNMEKEGVIAITVVPTTLEGRDTFWGPGIETSAKWLFDTFNPVIKGRTGGRVSISKVEVWEHDNNSAIYYGEY
jgi:6-pyruvoyltetrahydropterin/6-carboxytetrahydropterin synthase